MRSACSSLAAIALDLQPTQPAVETLGNRWRWLSGPAIAFHADRPRVRLGPVGFLDGFLRILTRTLRADVRTHDATAPDYLSALRAHR
jgi:hypothetical protein